MSAIELKEFSVSHKGKKFFEPASLKIEKGDCVLISGDNGSGKTTLFKALTNRLSVDFNCYGTLTIKGVLNDSKPRIAYMEQSDKFAFCTALEEMVYGVRLFAHCDSTEAQNECERLTANVLTDVQRTELLRTPLKRLSGGQKKLVSNLCVFTKARYADILLLDEPLNNLDDENMLRVSNGILRLKRQFPLITILIISHCKIFPFIDKLLILENHSLRIESVKKPFTACFALPDQSCFYALERGE